MVSFSRRALLAASAAGGLLAGAAARVRAQTFGNPDLPPQGAINAQNPRSLNDPGPQNPTIASQFPDAVSPPATDVGGLPQNWASSSGPYAEIRRARDEQGWQVHRVASLEELVEFARRFSHLRFGEAAHVPKIMEPGSV